MSASRTRLLTLLAPVVEAVGADLEDLAVQAAGRRSVVRVVVDRDGGVSLDDVADISRALSAALDDIDAREPALLGGAYVLEVSSPGVDRPLTEPRHWRRNATRLVKAVLHDGSDVTGRVLRVEDDTTLVLDVAGTERALPLADVARGLVQVEFDRPGVVLPEGPDDGDDDEHDDGDDDEHDDEHDDKDQEESP